MIIVKCQRNGCYFISLTQQLSVFTLHYLQEMHVLVMLFPCQPLDVITELSFNIKYIVGSVEPRMCESHCPSTSFMIYISQLLMTCCVTQSGESMGCSYRCTDGCEKHEYVHVSKVKWNNCQVCEGKFVAYRQQEGREDVESLGSNFNTVLMKDG